MKKKVIYPNGTSSTYWSRVATTKPILSDEFYLEDFKIELSQSENRKSGNAIASWTHTHGCVTRLFISLHTLGI